MLALLKDWNLIDVFVSSRTLDSQTRVVRGKHVPVLGRGEGGEGYDRLLDSDYMLIWATRWDSGVRLIG